MPLVLALLLSANFVSPVLTVPIAVAAPLEISDLQNIAYTAAERYDLTEQQTERMMRVTTCESNWDNDAIGPLGEIGAIQFYPEAHPELTRAQMKDVYFEFDWMAREFSLKHYSLWSCYRLLGF